MEYGNGIMGDMCIHMFDMTRWMLDLGLGRRVLRRRAAIPCRQGEQGDISGTPKAPRSITAICMSCGNTAPGATRPTRTTDYSWGATFFGDKGTLNAIVYADDFTRLAARANRSRRSEVRTGRVSRRQNEKDLERHRRPRDPPPLDRLPSLPSTSEASLLRNRTGYISTSICILANLSMKLGRSLKWTPRNR